MDTNVLRSFHSKIECKRPAGANVSIILGHFQKRLTYLFYIFSITYKRYHLAVPPCQMVSFSKTSSYFTILTFTIWDLLPFVVVDLTVLYGIT